MPTFLFLALSLILSPTSCSNGNHTTILYIRQCQFYINPPTTNLTFLYCLTPNTTIDSSWQSCIDVCCYGMTGWQYPTPDYDTLTLCGNKVRPDFEKDEKILMIGISVASAFIFVSCILAACKISQFLFARDAEVSNDLNGTQNVDRSKVTSSAQELQWIKRYQEGQTTIKMDSLCSICLQQSCYVQLCCSHTYHPECIGAWLLKGDFCPNCHHQRIRFIRQYCIDCRQSYFIIKIDSFFSDVGQFKGARCSVCLGRTEEERDETLWKCKDDNRVDLEKSNILLASRQ